MKAIFLITVLVCVSTNAEATTLKVALSVDEQALAERIIPSLADGVVTQADRTVFGGLVARAGGRRWNLHHVDVLSVEGKEERWVMVWLYPQDEAEMVPGYLCDECEANGIVAYLRGEEVIAVMRRPLTLTGAEVIQMSQVLRVGKTRLLEVVRRHRSGGEVSDVAVYFKRKGRRVLELGSIPIRAGNEGVCGSFAFILEKERVLGSMKRCEVVWRFDSTVVPTRRGLKVQERLQTAKAKRKRKRRKKREMRFHPPKERKRTVIYRVGRTRLRPSRSSLRHVH